MQIKRLLVAFALGLGLTLALVWLLSGAGLPVARAASFTVDITNDENDGSCVDGDCSLRDAIVVANGSGGADVITLGSGTHVLTITGTGENAAATGDLDVTEALTITGQGPGQTIIDASGIISDRVFDIRPGAGTVVISGVTIMGGNITGNGGGIYNYDADLILINATICNNVVTGTGSNGMGGGVFARGSTTLSGVQILSNTASNDGGGVFVGVGGATLSGGQVLSNTADRGGGVFVDNAAFTQTGATTFVHNSANHGGGVFIYRGGGSAALNGSQVLSNSAFYGGGVYVWEGGATLSGCQILSNTANNLGGGVYVNAGGSATLSGTKVVSNSAYMGGGVSVYTGSLVLNGGQVLSNTATTYGGGVHVDLGRATLNNVQVLDNTANERGGGVYIAVGSAALSGTEVLGNRANAGGGVYVAESRGVFTQTGGVLAHNTAAAGGGGGLHVAKGRATLNGGQVVSNTANYGGGLYVSDGAASLTLVNTTVSRNATSGNGGGLCVNDGVTAITYTTIASNTAATGGGGIHWMSGTVALQNTIVAHNGTTNCVGALTSNGHNLDSGTTCGFAATGDITDTNPLLGPLADNGGDTLTHALLEGSPAIDAGICLAGITTDQRGETRPQGAACDIGAYEFFPVAPASVSISGLIEGAVGESYTFTAAVSPPTATHPLAYTWSPMPDSGQGTEAATYSWDTAGAKTISVTAENAGGITPSPGTHVIEIRYKVYLPLVLKES